MNIQRRYMENRKKVILKPLEKKIQSEMKNTLEEINSRLTAD